MNEKRFKKATEDAEDAKANELIRRKAGKVRAELALRAKTADEVCAVGLGCRTGQRGSEEQADIKGSRGEAPRSVMSYSPLFPSLRETTRMIVLEKEDDKKALAAIKVQIEADKLKRAQKAAQEKALREGVAPPEAPTGTSAAPSGAPATVSVPGREFKDTRLQIRLASGGQPLTTTLPSDASCVFWSLVLRS